MGKPSPPTVSSSLVLIDKQKWSWSWTESVRRFGKSSPESKESLNFCNSPQTVPPVFPMKGGSGLKPLQLPWVSQQKFGTSGNTARGWQLWELCFWGCPARNTIGTGIAVQQWAPCKSGAKLMGPGTWEPHSLVFTFMVSLAFWCISLQGF